MYIEDVSRILQEVPVKSIK